MRYKKALLENKRALLENERTIPRNKRALLENKRVILQNKRAILRIKRHFWGQKTHLTPHNPPSRVVILVCFKLKQNFKIFLGVSFSHGADILTLAFPKISLGYYYLPYQNCFLKNLFDWAHINLFTFLTRRFLSGSFGYSIFALFRLFTRSRTVMTFGIRI